MIKCDKCGKDISFGSENFNGSQHCADGRYLCNQCAIDEFWKEKSWKEIIEDDS